MEKIKISNKELEIVRIIENNPLLEIIFPQATNLAGIDLSKIELMTSGGILCANLIGYITIYKVDGNSIVLSNDGSVYTEPLIKPVEPYEPTPEEITSQFDNAKKIKVELSKTLLDSYLTEHHLLFTEGKYYSVTREKQNLLNNAISVYQMKIQYGESNPTIKWNATGEQCTEWTINNITALALSIAAYVEPLVAKQQAYEIQINSCTIKEELESMVINYETTT